MSTDCVGGAHRQKRGRMKEADLNVKVIEAMWLALISCGYRLVVTKEKELIASDPVFWQKPLAEAGEWRRVGPIYTRQIVGLYHCELRMDFVHF